MKKLLLTLFISVSIITLFSACSLDDILGEEKESPKVEKPSTDNKPVLPGQDNEVYEENTTEEVLPPEDPFTDVQVAPKRPGSTVTVTTSDNNSEDYLNLPVSGYKITSAESFGGDYNQPFQMSGKEVYNTEVDGNRVIVGNYLAIQLPIKDSKIIDISISTKPNCSIRSIVSPFDVTNTNKALKDIKNPFNLFGTNSSSNVFTYAAADPYAITITNKENLSFTNLYLSVDNVNTSSYFNKTSCKIQLGIKKY